jgi:hypothetical protein
MSVIKNVAFFGYAEAREGDDLYESARETAKILAGKGYTIVNGGGPGVMKASTTGAHEGGGRAIGVTFYPKDAMDYEGRDPGNRFDEEVVTKHYVSRTLKLMELGQIFIVFNGGTGTLSEFGMAWGLARLYFGHHKPLILFGEFWKEVVRAISQNMHLRPWDTSIITIVRTPKDAARAVESIRKSESGTGAEGEEDASPGPFSL